MDKMPVDMRVDVVVTTADQKRHTFKAIPAKEMVKVQLAVSNGDGFVLSDGELLVAYAPGSVLRVGITEYKESK